jgi:hypothetical protein
MSSRVFRCGHGALAEACDEDAPVVVLAKKTERNGYEAMYSWHTVLPHVVGIPRWRLWCGHSEALNGRRTDDRRLIRLNNTRRLHVATLINTRLAPAMKKEQ